METNRNSISQDEFNHAQRALADKIARWTEKTPHLTTQIPGLGLRRYEAPTEPRSYMHEPSICLVAQGSKRVLLDKEEFAYDANHYLISSVDLPVVASVTEASREVPLLGLILQIDLQVVAKFLMNSALPDLRGSHSGRGLSISEVSLPLLDAFTRLLDLLDSPADIPILAPLLKQEILYRMLTGDQGVRLRQMATTGSQGHQISRTIDWLKANYTQPVRVESLAKQAGMSTSTFHHHFRTVTSMSPLQFQKWLRLHEARRLMLTEHRDAASASFQVGYESPSQFSREYKGLFGAPPIQDIKRLQQTS